MNKQEAKLQVEKLVEKYQRILEAGKIKSYNEAQSRNEFIEPLFGYLGWDMRNLATDNEVTTEENVSGGRVDLAFRLNNIPAMFLEAKAMKVDLDESGGAEQVINYSWNKGVTWAVLTDFESIKIFNAEIPPKKLSENLFIEIKCQDFVSRFDQLWLLSKESFEQKLLDKQGEKWGKIVQRKQVGEKLFEDLMTWRTRLTREFKKKNDLANEELDEGVQRILDRLIFIRTAEDRTIEPKKLLGILHTWESSARSKNLYKQLVEVFRDFDDGYDSKLFEPHYSEEWEADDKLFSEIIDGLYHTEEGYRYDFSAISADVLGGMYEQYLSYVQGRKSEEKEKSKRKSQGIYYTPKYIVEFIVRETLGELLKQTKAKDISKIKILDPACGSGSFLTAAYDKILETISKKNPQISLFTKTNILKENIYGIDLDAQAVEIAQLNLLLKVLSQRYKLPMLQHNLSVGNSLIPIGDPKYKPFDFQKNFQEVFEQGGFDIIIGNPPYIKEYTNRAAFDGLHDSPYYQGKMDIWTLFACKALDLLKDGGYFSFIAPNNWLTNAGASIFRNKILSEGEIIKLIDFGDFKVFKDAGIQTMIFIFQRRNPRKSYNVAYAKVTDKNIGENSVSCLLQCNLKFTKDGVDNFAATIKPKELVNKNIVFVNKTSEVLLAKIEARRNYELTSSEVAQGIVGDPDKAFVFSADTRFNESEKKVLFYYYTSVGKYHGGEKRGLIAYLNNEIESIDNMPNIKKQLEAYLSLLKNRREVKNGRIKWFQLHWPRDRIFFGKGPKIISAIRTIYPNCFYTDIEYYGSRAMNFIKTDRINLKFLSGLLNSRLSYFWLKNKGKQLGDLLQIDKGPLLNIPLLKPDENTQNRISLLVEKMMKLQEELYETSPNTDKWHSLKTEVEKLDLQIDNQVYELYGLTEEEIGIISEG